MTRKVIVSVNADGTARVMWVWKSNVMGVDGDLMSIGPRRCDRAFASQEDAEHFAAGVQAGLISAGLSATVEIVEVGEVARGAA